MVQEQKTDSALETRELQERLAQSVQRASQKKMEERPARSRRPSCGQQDPMTRCGRQRPESRAAIEPCAEPKRRRARNEAGQRRQDEAGGSGCQPEAKRKNMMPRHESRAHLQAARGFHAEPERRRARREAGQRRQNEAGGSNSKPGLQTSANRSKARKKRASAKRKNLMPRDESRAHLQQAYEANQRRRSTAETHDAKQRRRWHDEESSGS